MLNYFVTLLFLACSQIAFAQGYILGVGGGQERYGDWSDDPYRWMVEKSGYGKIINIDVDPTSSWYPEYFKYLGASQESHSKQIQDISAANSEEVYNELKTANGIFIEGGSQWDYVSTWKGTKVEQAIREIYQSGGVIGGTSAGLAVLGEIVFDAKYGSAKPAKAVYDAYIPQIHFEDNFLSLLPGILTDSHFTMRGRLGRLVPMIARWMQDNPGSDILGLGVDENTAICIDPNLVGEVFGDATVTVIYKTAESQIFCPVGQASYFTNIAYAQLIEGCIYDLQNRSLVNPGQYLQETGSTPPTPDFSAISLNGSLESTSENGSYVIENLFSSQYAAFYGNLSQRSGNNAVPNSIIMPCMWSDSDYYENRLAGAQWGVASHPHFTSIILDDYNHITINENGILSTNYLVHILDTFGAAYTGLNSRGCQIPGIIGAKLHFLTRNTPYDLKEHKPVTESNVKNILPALPDKYFLFNNYPNPFNSGTRFVFSLRKNTFVRLTIYNLLGKKIRTLINGQEQSGKKNIFWDGKNAEGFPMPSGIYIVELETEIFSRSIKLLKVN